LARSETGGREVMIPKETALQLVNSFYELPQTDLLTSYLKLHLAKMSALVTVDEILKHCYEVMKPFWEEVKQEIEKL
jgi:hypothetical protein